jgi:simple sugar transport system ATP-binding protein
MAFVPEERLGHGSVPSLSLSENMQLAEPSHGFIDWSAREQAAQGVVSAFDVRTSGVSAPARSLSGGNLQKFIVGRELAAAPAIIIVAQPTWGVDAGAAARIHQALLDRAAAGAAILVVSQDLDELFTLAHRIAVIAGGKLSPPTHVEDLSADTIGRLMGGV